MKWFIIYIATFFDYIKIYNKGLINFVEHFVSIQIKKGSKSFRFQALYD